MKERHLYQLSPEERRQWARMVLEEAEARRREQNAARKEKVT